ncbi:MAG TPA: glycosyl hydrolase, partial [Povalibacter sp.]|nr:glycosyl hydrolase [Povalibacter sp.]
AGCAGAGKLHDYERWLGRNVDQTLEFISWEVLEAGTAWAVNCWKKSDDHAVVYSMPMLPPNRSAKLAQGADGQFDDLFRRYAELLIQHGFARSIVRIGWEFNANWYAWDASKDPQAWIAYWRRIATTMRNTPGAQFKFDWCVSGGPSGFAADKAWPGDDVVDFVGMDYYNMPIDKTSVTPQQRWDARMNMQHGLKWHREFAQSHRKPMSIPEWGTGQHVKWGGGGDDPSFIERMAQWIGDNHIAYHNYWDYRNKDFDSKLSDGRQPQAEAAFLRFFGGHNRGANVPGGSASSHAAVS